MSILLDALFDFDCFEPLPIQIEVSDAPLTSDAGLLPLRQFDEPIGLTRHFAAVLDDPRDPRWRPASCRTCEQGLAGRSEDRGPRAHQALTVHLRARVRQPRSVGKKRDTNMLAVLVSRW